MTIFKMDLLSQNPTYSDDPTTKGFDLSTAKTWIYPENYPIRDYQYTIVESALYNNTLVCLPTGLGKTFIAAVVMYNYWRWYPQGKIVFLAPTRPLVAQQINACHNIMGIPSTETIELTGNTNQKQREWQWSKKRVIFATPQVFQKDLLKNIIPSQLVKCVVVDEAHKALGKHSYCECIRILSERNPYFRILALSATPGNKMDKVHEVVQNLHISQIELRDETSHDIKPYINERKVDVILVPLSKELADFQERYLNIMDPHVKYLYQCHILPSEASNITKGRIFFTLQEFKKRPNKAGNHGQIMKTLNILLTMYHAYELMVRHGLRAFIKFYQTHSDKFWMNSEFVLQDLLADVQSYLGPFPDVHLFPDGEIPEIPANIIFGHNKFIKLKELLVKHFQDSSQQKKDTRAIVFVEYKDIVSEVHVLLLQLRPLVRPQMFVGQSGQKQRLQIKALQDFRDNHVNVLISTSIGEEGLDVGEVDLIICFDVSQQSPTRLVQRMGRTGRKRDGHIIVLVTDGKEHDALKSTIRRRDSMNNRILNTSYIHSSFYEHNPRMIPQPFTPECHKRLIYIHEELSTEKRKGGRKQVTNKKLHAQPTLQKHLVKLKDKTDVQDKLSENITQPLMSKFLIQNKKQESSKIQTNEEQPILPPVSTQAQGIIRNAIKSSNVKLLTCDNDTIDFLTLCAIKQSGKETSKEHENQLENLCYMPSLPLLRREDLNFKVPDTKILDCLSSLNENVVAEILAKTKEANDGVEKDEVNELDDYIANPYEGSIFKDYKVNEQCFHVNDECFVESKFESILEDTSDSNPSAHESDKGNADQASNNFVVSGKSSGNNDISQSAVTSDIDEALGVLELNIFDDMFNDTPEVNQEDTVCGERNLSSEDVANADNTIFEHLFKDSDSENESEIVLKEKRGTPIQTEPAWKEEAMDVKSTESFGSLFEEDDDFVANSPCANIEPEKRQSVAKSVSIFNNINNSTSKAMTALSLSASNKDSDVRANGINSLEQEYFNETLDTFCGYREAAIAEKPNDNKADYMGSADDMFDFDSTDMNFEDKEENVPISNEPSANKSRIIILSDSDSDEIRDNEEKRKVGERSKVINKNVECVVDDVEWNSDFEAPETPLTDKSNRYKSSTPTIFHVSSKNKTEIMSDDEDDASNWISIKPSNSARKSMACTSLKKLTKPRGSLRKKINEELFSYKGPTVKSQVAPKFDDNDADFVINANEDKLCELANSFFSKKSSTHDKSSFTDTSLNGSMFSLDRDDSYRSIETDLSVFKAPNKYLDASKTSCAVKERRNERLENLKEQGRKKIECAKDKKKRRNRLKSEFLDCEAEVSGEDSSDESSGLNDDLDDFVSYTQNISDAVDMQAHYLQAVRSPLQRFGAFVIKERKSPDHEIEIYSQPASQEHESYIYDSFCVAGDEDRLQETSHNLGYTILEKAERALRKKRKRRDSTEESDSRRKKNTKVLNTSISSEDELEKMRREILDESMAHKDLYT